VANFTDGIDCKTHQAAVPLTNPCCFPHSPHLGTCSADDTFAVGCCHVPRPRQGCRGCNQLLFFSRRRRRHLFIATDDLPVFVAVGGYTSSSQSHIIFSCWAKCILSLCECWRSYCCGSCPILSVPFCFVGHIPQRSFYTPAGLHRCIPTNSCIPVVLIVVVVVRNFCAHIVRIRRITTSRRASEIGRAKPMTARFAQPNSHVL
jgi:hypothetical protein